MTDIVQEILTGLDDGYSYSLPYFSADGTACYFGNISGYSADVFLRFDNVSIPAGAEISSAVVRFTADGASAGATCNVQIYFEDEDDPDAPTNRTDQMGRDLTSAVAWNSIGAWSDGVTYDSPELYTILQNVIDRAGWNSGQALIVHIRDNASSSNAIRLLQPYEQSPVGTLSAELRVTYDITQVDDGFTISDNVDADDGSEYAYDDFTIADSADRYLEVDRDVSDDFTIDDTIQAGFETEHSVSDDFTIADSTDRFFEVERVVSDDFTIADETDCFLWSEWIKENYGKYVVRYFLTLTGDADGLSDQELPWSSFQSTKRNGTPTYLSAIVPTFQYISEITNRSNGDLKVDMAYLVDGVESFRENIVWVDLDTIRMDQGPRRQSITLSGSRTYSYGSNLILLENPTYKYVSDGKIKYRFLQADPWLNPGDVVQCRTDEFVVDYVTFTISDRFKQMDVSET